MLRRLHPIQPESFAFTPANLAWAEAQIAKYPQGRQASAVIPLLWRAQEQEGWLTRPAIEHIGTMLGMAYIRVLEVATFYFMFQLAPVGSLAHVQVCGTLSCMICGAEDLVAVCKRRIAAAPHTLSADGRFSWEEVECLGACANAPMVQIGKDYYEDLTAEKLEWLLDELAAGRVPRPGPQNGRFTSEPLGGVTSLDGPREEDHNGSVALAVAIGDTIKRIDGTEVPLIAPWIRGAAPKAEKPVNAKGKPAHIDNLGRAPAPKPVPPEVAEATEPKPAAGKPVDETGITVQEAREEATGKPESEPAAEPVDADRPAALTQARETGPDDLKLIKGVGPKLEALLHSLGIFHFDQIAAWSGRELAWIDAHLEGFKGRASRDEWVAQAKTLAGQG